MKDDTSPEIQDSVPEFTPPHKKHKKRKRRGILALKVFVITFIVILSTGFLFSYKVLSVGKDIFVQFDEKKTSFFGQFSRLVLSENKAVAGEQEGRTNILLLGMGGEGHTGAELTDTIMIASIKHHQDSSNKDVALISIPRDLYVSNGSYKQKINAMYASGKKNGGETSAATAISETVSDVTGLPIHYYIRVDFEGFRKIIDAVNGIEVDIERGFVDSQYPTYNFGYQTVEFEKGSQSLDGERALIYSRSRHGIVTDGEGSEGNDFARAQRQQKVLQAARTKALSLGTLVNPKKINELLDALGDHVRTNIQPWELMSFVEMAKKINTDDVISQVVDNSESGLLYSSNAGGAYVLLPVGGDYSKIHHMSENIFFIDKIDTEDVEVFVLNGTKKAGLARLVADDVEKMDINVSGVGNTISNSYIDTKIIVLKDAPLTVELLQAGFNATASKGTVDSISELTNVSVPEETDIIVVAGSDATNE